MTQTSPVSEVLKQAHAALLRIRTASIAGCEEGYGKPEKWADELFASHGDVTAAMKAIDGVLSSAHAQTEKQQIKDAFNAGYWAWFGPANTWELERGMAEMEKSWAEYEDSLADTSTVLKSENASPVGWGGHLPGKIEP
jgi:hypothetical protein